MVLEMKIPSPGESITEVEISQWLVKDGDVVRKDQTIAELDSDKATLDLPAEASGKITLKAHASYLSVLFFSSSKQNTIFLIPFSQLKP